MSLAADGQDGNGSQLENFRLNLSNCFRASSKHQYKRPWFVLSFALRIKVRSSFRRSKIIDSFRLENEYGIEYEYDFRISNQFRSQSRRFSLLLIIREVESLGTILVCYVMILSMRSRFEKSYAYSISFSHSNLKSPNVVHGLTYNYF